MKVFQSLTEGPGVGREGGAWEDGGEWALILGASSELHFQLIWTVGSRCPEQGGWVGSFLLLTQSRDSMVKETEVD